MTATEPRPSNQTPRRDRGDAEALSHAGGRQARSDHARREAARRFGLRLAAPAGARVLGGDADDGRADHLLSIAINAPLRDHSEPEPDAEPGQGAVVLPRPARAFCTTSRRPSRACCFRASCWSALAMLPYVDRNPSRAFEDRKLSITLFTIFALFFAVTVARGQLLPRLRLAVDLALAAHLLRSVTWLGAGARASHRLTRAHARAGAHRRRRGSEDLYMAIDTTAHPAGIRGADSGGGAESAEIGPARPEPPPGAAARGRPDAGVCSAREATYRRADDALPQPARPVRLGHHAQEQGHLPARSRTDFALDQTGIFYEPAAKSYIMHLLPGGSTAFLLQGSLPQRHARRAELGQRRPMAPTGWRCIRSASIWAAKYPSATTATASSVRATARTTTSMASISTAPRRAASTASRCRSRLAACVNVDTGKLNQHVQHPDDSTRILAVPDGIPCTASVSGHGAGFDDF